MRLPIALIAATLLLPCTAHADVIDYYFTGVNYAACHLSQVPDCSTKILEFQMPSNPTPLYTFNDIGGDVNTGFVTDDFTIIQNTTPFIVQPNSYFGSVSFEHRTVLQGTNPTVFGTVDDITFYNGGTFVFRADTDNLGPFFTGPVTSPTLLTGTFRGGFEYSSDPFVGKLVITDISPPTVPEPSSLALLGTGALGILAATRRRFGH